jgi:hypothetical protein
MMRAEVTDLELHQGDTFKFALYWEADGAVVNLTGYNADMVITWPDWFPANALPITAGEKNCTMTLTAATGKIEAHIDSTETGDIPLSGPYNDGPRVQYQLRVRQGAEAKKTLLVGNVNVFPNRFDLVT